MGLKSFFRRLFKRDKIFNVDRDGFPKFKEWPRPELDWDKAEVISKPGDALRINEIPFKIGETKLTYIWETEKKLKKQREELRERLIDIDKKLMIFNNRRNCQETAAQDKEFMEMGMTPVILNGDYCYVGPPGKPDED